MKRLKPSERKKKRYVGFKIFSNNKIDQKEFLKVFFKTLKDFFGENICSEIEPVLVYFKKDNNIGIIRCNHKYVDHVISCLLLINEIKGERVICYTLGVSGTIKSLIRKTGISKWY